ncbi:hypothetical protein OKW21_001432 [Catalinimonas alkaloidigena]|uniref:hypothetical protein n=1 Tax=Catalinimonas alkaloidigena TaxID=1075417 RepID=UPI0024070EFF|nr:hypothetical protein [Catalinimonas alkaloidigena]MDF9796169.1 hypothetical protein [Catalinimonas alkaloidigena]
MNYTSRPTILWALLSLCLFVSCEELCDCDPKPCLFSYDGVSYTKTTTGEQLISPTFTEGESEGTFSASPNTLVLNDTTGVININTSDPGEYTITYTPENGDPDCSTTIVIQEAEPVITECKLDYGKILFIPGEDMFASPQNSDQKEFTGTFSAKPNGLDIDPETGIINIDLSEPGLLYEVSFISEDGLTRCTTQILIAGIDYPDVIIDFSNPEETSLIEPAINRNNPDFEAAIDFDPQGQVQEQGISFAETDEDTPPGTINLRQTFINLELLGVEITDGFTREFIVPYIYRGGNTVVEGSIPIQIYWFEEEVPEELQQWIGRKNQESNNGRMMHRHSIMVGVNKFQ